MRGVYSAGWVVCHRQTILGRLPRPCIDLGQYSANANRQCALSALHVQIHLLRGHRHVAVEIPHDPERSSADQEYDEHAKRECQHIVRTVRCAGDMQEEDQVNTHLGNGAYCQAERNTGRPDQRGVGDPKRCGRKDHSEGKSDRVDPNV